MLVVGASATGVQLADEIHRSGRPVTLSVGEHVRLPRTYRGRDVLWWMDASGVWNQRYDEIDDLDARAAAAVAAARRHARAHDAGPQCPQRDRRRARRPAGRRARRPGAVFGRAAQSVRAGRPQDGSPARHVRRLGAAHTRRDADVGAPGALRADARARIVAARSSTCEAARSARSSGPPGFGPTTAGSTCRSSTRRATCGTTAAWSMRQGCTRSGCPSCGGASRRFIHGAEDDARDVIDHLARYLAGGPSA